MRMRHRATGDLHDFRTSYRIAAGVSANAGAAVSIRTPASAAARPWGPLVVFLHSHVRSSPSPVNLLGAHMPKAKCLPNPAASDFSRPSA